MFTSSKINNPKIYKRALEILQSAYGQDAYFRDHQYEAIESVLINRRTLVVEKTGWGKVLFILRLPESFQNQVEESRLLSVRCLFL